MTQGLDPRPPRTACAARAARRAPRCTRSNPATPIYLAASAAIGCRASPSHSRCCIGRPFDRALLEKLRAGPRRRAGVVGRPPDPDVGGRGRAGRRSPARSSVARRRRSFAAADADWTAAAVPVADKLWVLGLAHRSARALPLAATLACGLAGLALVLAGAALLFRRRRSRAEADPVEAGAAVAAAAHAPFPPPPRGRAGRRRSLAASTPAPLTFLPGTRATPPGGAGAGAVAAATALAAEGGQQFGRYRLIERIGEGGMAEVFTALLSGAEGFERLVVIKRLKPHLALNPEAVSQFIDEAKLGSVLTHSNIVTVSDFGKVGDGYYLAAEFVDGRTLAQIATRYREKYARTLPGRDRLSRRPRGAGGHRLRARTGGRAGAPAGDRPPRHLAQQHHDQLRGRGEAARLRHRQGHRARVEDAGRQRQGQRRLHVARAGPRAGRVQPFGSVLARGW